MSMRLLLASDKRFASDLPAILNRPVSALIKLGGLRGLAAKWRERFYFRNELRRMAKEVPHLIDDIGLTMRQAEAEIEKPFWRA